MAWGGAKEQQEEIAKGNLEAKDWQAEARKVVEDMMESYHSTNRPPTPTPTSTPAPPDSNASDDEYDRLRRGLLAKAIQNEGWRSELRRYLDDMPSEVTKDTDVVEWWSVSTSQSFFLIELLMIITTHRSMRRCTLPSPRLPSTCFPPKRRPFLANGFSQVARRSQSLGVLNLVPISSNNCRC
jgi:hypothetical protein